MSNLTNKKHSFKLRIPSDTKDLEIIRNFVYSTAVKLGFDKESAGKIELSVDEACSNVIRHAYDMKSNNYIEIDIIVDMKRIVIIITDRGKAFDPAKIKKPNMQEYIARLKVGGLGIYMMRMLMDEVEYDIKPGVKNRVKLVKYFENQ